MREIRMIRKTAKSAGSAVGAIAVPVVAIALIPQFLVLAAIALAIALLIIAVGMVRDHRATQPAPYRVEDDPAAQAHRAKMRNALGYDVYTR